MDNFDAVIKEYNTKIINEETAKAIRFSQRAVIVGAYADALSLVYIKWSLKIVQRYHKYIQNRTRK